MTVEWLLVGMSFMMSVLLVWSQFRNRPSAIWMITLIGLAAGILCLPQSFSVNVFLVLFYVLAICLVSNLNRVGQALLILILAISLGLMVNSLISERWFWVGLCLSTFLWLVVMLIQGKSAVLPAWLTVLLMAAVLLLVPEWSDNVLLASMVVASQLYLLLSALSNAENLKKSELPTPVAEIQAAERSRIYQNIHDDVGAELLRLIYLLDDGVQQQQVKDIMQKLRRAVAQTTQMNSDVQQLTDEMIEICRQRMSEANIECQCQAAITYNYTFSNTHPTGLLRIMNELLTNITRHSQAQKVCLFISSDVAGLSIKLTDNGCGLKSASNAGSNGRGMRGLRKRAAEMGAQIEWRNMVNKGLETNVNYSWPS